MRRAGMLTRPIGGLVLVLSARELLATVQDERRRAEERQRLAELGHTPADVAALSAEERERGAALVREARVLWSAIERGAVSDRHAEQLARSCMAALLELARLMLPTAPARTILELPPGALEELATRFEQGFPVAGDGPRTDLH
jgi:hypothetical protein